MDNYPSSPLILGLTYNFCAWAKGNVGGEKISFSYLNSGGQTNTLSTSWKYLCSGPVTTIGNPATLGTVWVVTSKNLIETFFLAGSSTTLVGNSNVYLPTGATPSPTPTPTLALPWLAPGNLCVTTGGLVASSGCGPGISLTTTGTTGAASLTGTVLNIPQYAAGLTQLTGATSTITGTSLTNACDTGTAAVTGAVVGHTVGVSTTDGTDVGANFTLRASVTSTNTITVSVCNPTAVAATPPSKAYTVTTY